MSNITEFDLIKIIKKGLWHDESVILGIGDDAAVIEPTGPMAITTDCLAESVHFLKKSTSPSALASKAVVSNISDLIVMGAVPKYMLLNLNIAADTGDDYVISFIRSLKKQLKQQAIMLIGGNISSGNSGFMVNITLLGKVTGRLITRSGAQIGDSIYVMKPLGAAAIAVDIMLNKISVSKENREKKYFSLHLFKEETNFLANHINSAIDISDGFAQDLSHICESSNVGADVALEKVPVSQMCREILKNKGLSKEDIAMYAASSGEEYVPLFTAPSDEMLFLAKDYAAKFHKKIYEIGKIRCDRGLSFFYNGRKSEKMLSGFDHLNRDRLK